MATDKEVKRIVKEALEKLVNDDEKMKVMSYATQITPTVFKILEEQKKKFIDFEYESRVLFFGFIESIEQMDESFCDCEDECDTGSHSEECQTSLFRKDIERLEDRFHKLKEKHREIFALQKETAEVSDGR